MEQKWVGKMVDAMAEQRAAVRVALMESMLDVQMAETTAGMKAE